MIVKRTNQRLSSILPTYDTQIIVAHHFAGISTKKAQVGVELQLHV